jgi:hypothetical protein
MNLIKKNYHLILGKVQELNASRNTLLCPSAVIHNQLPSMTLATDQRGSLSQVMAVAAHEFFGHMIHVRVGHTDATSKSLLCLILDGRTVTMALAAVLKRYFLYAGDILALHIGMVGIERLFAVDDCGGR